jgi:hypothetical protein
MVWRPTELSLATVGDETALRIAAQDGAVTLVTISAKRS